MRRLRLRLPEFRLLWGPPAAEGRASGSV